MAWTLIRTRDIVAVCALALFMTACGKPEVVERYPQGKAKREVTYRLFGPKDSLRISEVKTYFFNGRLEMEARYRRGLLHGAYRDYWHNGQIKSQGEYAEGKREGHWKFFWNRFQPSSQGEYRGGFKEGPWLEYYENGELRKRGSYLRGREIGLWEGFDGKGDPAWFSTCHPSQDTGSFRRLHAGGNLHESYACRGGRPAGTYIQVHPDGQVELRGRYDSLGRRDSLWEGFHPDGKPASRQGYSAGLWHDSAKAWDSAGTLREQGYFIEGSGLMHRYDDSARLVESTLYRKGLKQGRQLGYFPSGKLRYDRDFHSDTLVSAETFHPQGSRASAGNYVLGQKSGPWSRWDTLGRLQEVSTYQGGVLEGLQVFYGPKGEVSHTMRYEHGYPAEGRFPRIQGAD